MSERPLRLFVTVGAQQFVAHVGTPELPLDAHATVGELVDSLCRCPRYASRCTADPAARPRVFLGRSGAFELLPSEPACVLRDGDEITFGTPFNPYLAHMHALIHAYTHRLKFECPEHEEAATTTPESESAPMVCDSQEPTPEEEEKKPKKKHDHAPPADLIVAAQAAAQTTEPVEERPPRAVRRVVRYDSDGEVASVAELPATRAPVAAAPEAEDATAEATPDAAAVTPERKRRRRRSRRARQSTEPVQTNVSVFMDADQPPPPSVPCTALLEAAEGAPEAAQAPEAEARQDYSALPTVAVDEVAAGDTIAWGDVVMEHSRPTLVWHAGVLRQRTEESLTVCPCDGTPSPVNVPVRSIFCLKRVRAAVQPQVQQQQQQQQQPEATTTETRRLSHPKSRGVSGVLSMLRKMGTETPSV